MSLNSKLQPIIPTEWFLYFFFFWKSPLSALNKHVAIMQWYCTLVDKSELNWLWKTTGLASPFTRPHSPWRFLLQVHDVSHLSKDFAHKRATYKICKMAVFIWNSPYTKDNKLCYKLNKPAYWEWKTIFWVMSHWI